MLRGTSNLQVIRLREGRDGGSFRGRRWVGEMVLIVVKHLLESVEIETISDVLLIDFAEELMVFEVAEPADPAVALFGAIGLGLRHYFEVIINMDH